MLQWKCNLKQNRKKNYLSLLWLTDRVDSDPNLAASQPAVSWHEPGPYLDQDQHQMQQICIDLARMCPRSRSPSSSPSYLHDNQQPVLNCVQSTCGFTLSVHYTGGKIASSLLALLLAQHITTVEFYYLHRLQHTPPCQWNKIGVISDSKSYFYHL